MKHSKIFTALLVSCLLCSCSSSNKPDLKDSQTISFITELALDYWDLNYKFPTSYQQSRDTTVWFFAQYTAIDSMLLRHDSEIKYWDQDWRKEGLVGRRYELVKEINFYNQLYCGCEFSRLRLTKKG